MFWVGFFSVYVILGILFILMLGSGKLFNKLSKVVINVKIVISAIMFNLFSYIFTLMYSLVAIITGNIMFNAVLCAVFLVFSWFLVNKLYQLMTGENGSEDDENRILLKEDKNICNLFSLIGVICSSIVLSYDNKSFEYFTLISIVVSIWIGAYIPISEIYKGTPVRVVLLEVLKEFSSKNKVVWISSIVCVVILAVFASNSNISLKLHTLIEIFGSGIAVGSIVLILLIAILGSCKKRKR